MGRARSAAMTRALSLALAPCCSARPAGPPLDGMSVISVGWGPCLSAGDALVWGCPGAPRDGQGVTQPTVWVPRSLWPPPRQPQPSRLPSCPPPGPTGCPELWTCWGRGGSLRGCHRGAAEGRRLHGAKPAPCSLPRACPVQPPAGLRACSVQPLVGLRVEGSLASGLAFPAPLCTAPDHRCLQGHPGPRPACAESTSWRPPAAPHMPHFWALPVGTSVPALGGAAEDPRREACTTDLAWGPIPPPPSPPGPLLGKVWLPPTLPGQAGLCDGGGPGCPDWSGVCSEAWAAWAWGWAGPRSARWDILWLRPGPPRPQPRPRSQAGRCG